MFPVSGCNIVQLPYLEMRTDHVDSTLTLSTTVYTMSIVFFLICPDFLTIFTLITIFGNVHKTMSTVSHIVNNSLFFFCLIFPDFLAIFVLITILGNAHRPCKRYPNIVNNSICHVYSVFLIFPKFLAIFTILLFFM